MRLKARLGRSRLLSAQLNAKTQETGCNTLLRYPLRNA